MQSPTEEVANRGGNQICPGKQKAHALREIAKAALGRSGAKSLGCKKGKKVRSLGTSSSEKG